jgi:large subunit ribosomal protein L22
MDIKATQKFVVESPKKLREVAGVLRTSKLNPLEALDRLALVGKRAADTLRKAITVAIANAKQGNVNPETLIFKEIIINDGPVLKRFRAGSRGRAKPYKKRMSHIRIVLTTKEQPVKEIASAAKVKDKKEVSVTKKDISKNKASK